MLYRDTLTLQSEWHTQEVLRWYPANLRNTEVTFNRNSLCLLRLRSERALMRNKLVIVISILLYLSHSPSLLKIPLPLRRGNHRGTCTQIPSPSQKLFAFGAGKRKIQWAAKMKRDFWSILVEENHVSFLTDTKVLFA